MREKIISVPLVWSIIEEDLPLFKEQIVKILVEQ